MAAIDDYLEVRPEQTDRLRALVERGQLAIGPCRVLMAEFLCSGETMIHNLELGHADAAILCHVGSGWAIVRICHNAKRLGGCEGGFE